MLIIIASLAATVILVLCYVIRRQSLTINFLTEERLQLAEENAHLRHRLNTYDKVISESVGGVEKRIREHQEIIETIEKERPSLLNDESGMKNWLKANNDFFHDLKTIVSNRSDVLGNI